MVENLKCNWTIQINEGTKAIGYMSVYKNQVYFYISILNGSK